MGNIAIYATIIGIFGNRHQNFKTELELQLQDFNRIGSQYPICIAGDFNISVSDNYYYTKDGRNRLNKAFKDLELVNLTENVPNNIDHIVISEGLVGGIGIESWNLDKKLSDHSGVLVVLDI